MAMTDDQIYRRTNAKDADSSPVTIRDIKRWWSWIATGIAIYWLAEWLLFH